MCPQMMACQSHSDAELQKRIFKTSSRDVPGCLDICRLVQPTSHCTIPSSTGRALDLAYPKHRLLSNLAGDGGGEESSDPIGDGGPRL